MVGEDKNDRKTKKQKQTNKQTKKKQQKNKKQTKNKHGFLAVAILLFIGNIIITSWPPWVVWKLFFLM